MAKSIKPGRMTSVGGIIGSIFVIVLGILSILFVNSFEKDVPPFYQLSFTLMGIAFIVLGIYGGIVSYHDAFSKNRYSIVDIVDSSEEPDAFGFKTNDHNSTSTHGINYCPNCGNEIQKDYIFCPSCGKKIR